jgi:hypothetical protein
MEFHFSVPQWYGLGAIFVIVTWQAIRVLRWIFQCFVSLTLYCIKHLAATLARILPWATIGEHEIILVICLLLYVVANTVCMGLQFDSHAELAARSGILATINLIPLLVGTHLGDVAEFLGVTLRIAKIVHRWIGCMTLLEGAIHILLVALHARMKWTPLEKWGTIVSQKLPALT